MYANSSITTKAPSNKVIVYYYTCTYKRKRQVTVQVYKIEYEISHSFIRSTFLSDIYTGTFNLTMRLVPCFTDTTQNTYYIKTSLHQ
jgi:hypothetical protein